MLTLSLAGVKAGAGSETLVRFLTSLRFVWLLACIPELFWIDR